MPTFNSTFTKGEKIKCIDAAASVDGLELGAVYTAAQDSRPGVRGEVVGLEEVASISWAVERFVPLQEPKPADWLNPIVNQPKIVVDHTMRPEQPGIFIGPEGIRIQGHLPKAPEPEIIPGTWVAVQGQVLEVMEGDDMDYKVEFFSHNEQYPAWVRKDRVAPIPTPGHVTQCTAMTVNVLDTNIYYRCEKREHRRFDKNHKSGAYEWLEGDTSGYVEEA